MDASGVPPKRSLKIEEGVLTTPEGHALPRVLDPVVTMDLVQRYVEQERLRSRRALLWLSTVFLCAILLVLILFVSIGIHVLVSSRETAMLAGRVEAQTKREVQEISAKVGSLDTGQKEITQVVKKGENQRQKESEMIKGDLERFGQWMVTSQTKDRDRLLGTLEARLKELQDAYSVKEKELAKLRASSSGSVLSAGPAAKLIPAAFPAPRETVSEPVTPTAARNVVDAANPAAGKEDKELPDDAAVVDSSEQVMADLKSLSVQTVEEFEKEAEYKGGPKGQISVVTFPTGDRYEGEFKDGLFNGWGSFFYANGDKYEGDFRSDMKDGRGVFAFKNGDKYSGTFKSDMKSGKGRLIFKNGDRYAGGFENDMINGKGTMLCANGNRYAGDFRNGLKHGSGLFSFANGDVYKGDFRNDLRQGRGTYLYANGAKYIGDFEGGKRHGRGRYVYPDGSEFVGEFKAGKKEGLGTSTYPNGKRVSGIWQNDSLVKTLDETAKD